MIKSSTNRYKISLSRLTDFIVLSILILFISANSTLVESKIFPVGVFVFLTYLFLKRNLKIEKQFIYIILLWILINILSAIIPNSNQPFSIITFIGVTLRMIIPYLIIKIVGKNIFEKLFNYIYYLTIISLILFSIQLLKPSLFYSVSSFLNFITQAEQKQAGGWYIFIYMFSGWAFDRNCGFMWEPGGFAAILVFSLIYQLVRNNYTIDKRVLIFSIALITTFSTAGYLALFFILIQFFIQRKETLYHPIYWVILIALIIFIPKFYKESDFMQSKIESYQEQGIDTRETLSGMIRVSRIGIAVIVLDYSFVWPFGNGILTNEYKIKKYGDVQGPNSLAQILHEWGWLGFILFYSLFYRYYYNYSGSKILTLLILLSISIVLFSNPFHYKYLIYAMIFYTLIYLKKPKPLKKYSGQLNLFL